MRKANVETFEVKLHLSGRESGGEAVDQKRLEALVRQLQAGDPRKVVAVRVAPFRLLAGEEAEDGWEVSAANDPRFPKTTVEIWKFMESLANHLMANLKQKRVRLATPETTVMIEDNTMPA